MIVVSLYCSEMLKGRPEGPGLLQEKSERSERKGFLHNLFIKVIHEYQNSYSH